MLSLFWLFVYAEPAYAWTYRIQRGDSLFKISRRFGGSIQTLKNDNRLKSSLIIAGETLWISDAAPKTNTRVASQVGSRDLHLLARLISGEARGESYEGQVAVGAVILNRVKSDDFPDTVRGNMFKYGEFESVTNGQIWEALPSSAIQAAKDAMAGYDPTGGAIYFYNPSKIASPSNWIWSRNVISRIGQHVFAI